MTECHQVLRPGFIYEVKRRHRNTRDARRYRFAIPLEYTKGTQGECWLVDAGHNLMPGFGPTHMEVTMLKKGVKVRGG